MEDSGKEDRPADLLFRLKQTDLDMSRICEDLISVLVRNNVIRMSDFTDQSRDKIDERNDLRARLRAAQGRKGRNKSL